ncbi:hypothetical protein [Herbiconiux ginsengi]|uniref:Uncharacterized protein n=1 Tax=Herbiconiux ginsengi TaxID=381665 RepID=A0A1H3LBC2_9MICO|nr:hypothetical protein [Herbiconiux ginsengi]SDY61691.1 hypothetical protein SAMN05216554_0907 [Herbiconiux ginsengi]
MTASSDRDKDPNLDEYAYEHRIDDDYGPGDDSASADEHADNPHPDADGDVTDPAAPDDTSGVIDPDAD